MYSHAPSVSPPLGPATGSRAEPPGRTVVLTASPDTRRWRKLGSCCGHSPGSGPARLGMLLRSSASSCHSEVTSSAASEPPKLLPARLTALSADSPDSRPAGSWQDALQASGTLERLRDVTRPVAASQPTPAHSGLGQPPAVSVASVQLGTSMPLDAPQAASVEYSSSGLLRQTPLLLVSAG